MDYFTTPYFLFFRETLSSVVLLGLLFVICLMPSTLTISELECVILLFFLGRVVLEVDKVMVAVKAGRRATRRRSRLLLSATHEEGLYIKQDADSSGQTVLLRKFANYLSDCWNMLDLIIVSIYVITFILHMITWVVSTSVSGNRSLAVAGYLYGFIALLLTLRAFGRVMEVARGMGTMQIAVFEILRDLRAIFWLFISTILGFSLAMTKIYVVEASYSSYNGSHKHLKCDASNSFACWWRIAEHLAWSLLGMTSRKFFSSDDSLSNTLGCLLYVLFLVMGVFLLTNILIALLTNTYQQVQDNSLREWSFKKATAINTYSACHPVPVPFNLISMPLVALSKLCQRCFFKRKFFEKPGVDVERRDAALDQVVMKLTRTYFATFGYSFPLTDERRMDQLLHETDKNRQMANQIIRQLFRHQDCEQRTFNAKACAWQSLGIGIENCLLTYEGPVSCTLCDTSKTPTEYHGARCLTPFTRENPRLEVLIQESGERRIVGVGVVYQGYNCHYMPGWIDGTVGYHADDGKIFEARCGDNLGREVADAMAYRGDLMACEVDFDGAKNGVIPIVFFKNSHVVGRTSMEYISGRTELFPYVAMGYKGIRVLAKMCPRASSEAQSSAAVQHITRDPDVYEKLNALRDEMMAMENKRREEAKEFQETLLNEIEKLGRAIRREKNGKCV